MLQLYLVSFSLLHVAATPVPKPPPVPKTLLKQRADVARQMYGAILKRLQMDRAIPFELFGWSERLLEAELGLCGTRAERRAAIKAHLDRTREVEKATVAYAHEFRGRASEMNAAACHRVEAEILLAGAADPAPAKLPLDLLKKRLDLARKVFKDEIVRMRNLQGFREEWIGWSARWLDAELPLCDKEADCLPALKAHLQRTRTIERFYQKCAQVGQGTLSDASAATWERVQAEVRLFNATHPTSAKVPRPLLKQRLDAIREAYTLNLTRLRYRVAHTDELVGWSAQELFGQSARWLDAEMSLCDNSAERLTALKGHLKRTREVEKLLSPIARAEQGRQADAARAATYERLQAEIRWFQVTGKKADEPTAPTKP